MSARSSSFNPCQSRGPGAALLWGILGRGAAVLAVAALVVSACGSESDAPEPAAATPTTNASEPEQPATTDAPELEAVPEPEPEPATTTTAEPPTTTTTTTAQPTETTSPPTTSTTTAPPTTTTTTAPPPTTTTTAPPATTTTTTTTTTAPPEPVAEDTASVQADEAAGVTAPPVELGFDPFYGKYLDLEGLPIIASAHVPDEALFQARLLIAEMLTNRPDVLATLVANDVRVAIMAEGSGITEIPELSDLYEAFPAVDWDNRTRGGGVGPTFARPVLAMAEENLLCYSTDLYPHEDIAVHEAAHAVLNMGIEPQSGGAAFRQRLERAYRDALDAGLWQHTYAAANPDEYWAEGVQSWFDVNDPPGPIHNEVNTRHELEEYDPALAGLIREALGEVTVSSCHSAATHPHRNSRILGTLVGPGGAGVEGVGVWAWSGDADTSGFATTRGDGTFAIGVPDGTFTLDIYANTGEDCTFVGWYGPNGFTITRGSAALVVVDGGDVSGIEIILPQPREELPFIEWCA